MGIGNDFLTDRASAGTVKRSGDEERAAFATAAGEVREMAEAAHSINLVAAT